MFIEGYINKEYLRILQELDYDIVWEIKDHKDAISKGYNDYWPEPTNLGTVVRIFIDQDIEDIITPKVMCLNRNNMLPLMAVSTNEKISTYASKQLKGENLSPQ